MVKGRVQNPSPTALQRNSQLELAEQEPEHDLLKPDPRLKVSEIELFGCWALMAQNLTIQCFIGVKRIHG